MHSSYSQIMMVGSKEQLGQINRHLVTENNNSTLLFICFLLLRQAKASFYSICQSTAEGCHLTSSKEFTKWHSDGWLGGKAEGKCFLLHINRGLYSVNLFTQIRQDEHTLTTALNFPRSSEFWAEPQNSRSFCGIKPSRGINAFAVEYGCFSLKAIFIAENNLKVALLWRHQAKFPIFLYFYLL